MTRSISIFAAIALTAAVSACATVAPEQVAQECAATDWERFGLNDGKLGVPTSDRASRFSDCAQVGAAVNLAAYQAGRSEGLLTYCTAENGYQVGYEGRRYQSVCPPNVEPDFLQGYERGKQDRPAVAVYPRIGIGIGTGGRVRSGIGIGIGVGSFYHGHERCDYDWRFGTHCW